MGLFQSACDTLVDASFPLSFVVQQVRCCHTSVGSRIEGSLAEGNPVESNAADRSPGGYNPDMEAGQDMNNCDSGIGANIDSLAGRVVHHSIAVRPVRVGCSHTLPVQTMHCCSVVQSARSRKQPLCDFLSLNVAYPFLSTAG